MGEAYFYHLTMSAVDQTLPMLLGKARGAGGRITVRGGQPERLAWLDEKLWLGPEEEFPAHGLAGGEHDVLQPILLTTGVAANDPACLMTIDGAELTPEEVRAMERVCVLFDGNDHEALQRARVQWKTLVDAGCGAKYWSEAGGRWEMKAESAAKDA